MSPTHPHDIKGSVTLHGDGPQITTAIPLKFKKLHPCAYLPSYITSGSAGMDVRLFHMMEGVPVNANIFIPPAAGIALGTGLAVEVPPGYELQVRPRSGLASQGLIVLNSPGTIDSDYRGEIKVLLHNLNAEHVFRFNNGDRIAQMVLVKLPRVHIEEVSELSDTNRDTGGFGSTGLR